MRVYLPTTLPGLATSYQAGEVGPAPLDAFAVTPGLREWYLSDDVEELEYAALLRAAQASLRLLVADPAAPRRRVVVAADVPAGLVRAEPVLLRTRAALGLVRVGEPVALGKARARLTAYFADVDGRPIASTARHSPLFASSPGETKWQPLTVELSADDPRAASLVVELGLLQPMHYAPTSLGERTLFTQDIRGSAWFDDVHG